MRQSRAFHDEHVEVMPAGFLHPPVIRGNILRIQLRNDLPRDRKSLLMMRVNILRVVGFDPVMAKRRKNHGMPGQQPFIILLMRNSLSFVEGYASSRKVPPVMHQADRIAVEVLPGPIQGGQFAEAPVPSGDVVASIVPDHAINAPVARAAPTCMGALACHTACGRLPESSFSCRSPSAANRSRKRRQITGSVHA